MEHYTDVGGLSFEVKGNKICFIFKDYIVGHKPKKFWVKLPPMASKAISHACKSEEAYSEMIKNMSEAEKAEYFKECMGS